RGRRRPSDRAGAEAAPAPADDAAPAATDEPAGDAPAETEGDTTPQPAQTEIAPAVQPSGSVEQAPEPQQ
ncbi:MAG: hypothetical protein OSA96_16535, partial [Aurantimonas coralicida]|nr:hypothetical protein [Aurantimonas coralicida]